MNASRRTGSIALVVLVFAIGAALIVFAGRSGGAPERGGGKQHVASGVLSILTHRGSIDDVLPPGVLATPAAERFGNPAAARLAMTVGDRQYFVVPGAADSICLIFAEGTRTNPTSAGTCADREALRTGTVYLSELHEDGTATIAGIVSDGINQVTQGASSVLVSNNVFVISDSSSPRLVLDGPTIDIETDLGAPAPTSTVKTP